MRIITVSDAHLVRSADPAYADLVTFLDTAARGADLVVFNGDIFEFFVGRQREAMQRYRPVLDRIESLTATADVVFIEGNHDFHLRRALPGKVRVAVRHEIKVRGRTTAWIHGDALAPTPSYRLLHRVLRSRPILWSVERLPPRLVWNLATSFAGTSRAHQSPVAEEDMRDLASAARRELGGADCLVTGHYHTSFRAELGAGREWWALGDWLAERWVWESDGQTSCVWQYPSLVV